MASASTEREATVFNNKKCQQCCENKSCCEAKSEVPASELKTCRVPTSKNEKNEQAVQDLQSCMTDFEAEPFDESNPTLRSLQSGLVASPELVQYFNMALQDGQTQAETILQERVFTKTKTLTATIHRNKRQNFASEKIGVSSGALMTVAHMERSGLAALLDGST